MIYISVFRDIGGISAYIPLRKCIFSTMAQVLGNMLTTEHANEIAQYNQKEATDRAEAFSRENWRKQIAREDYLNQNSMITQLSSMKSAGLNPNMLQGGYNQLTSNATPGSVAMSPAQTFATDVSGIGQLLQNAPVVNAHVKNIEADTKLKDKQAGVADADILLKQAQAWNIEELTPEQKHQMQEGTKKLIAEVHNIEVNTQLTTETINKVCEETVSLQLQNELTRLSTPLIIQKYASEIALLNKQGQLTDAQTAVAYKSLSVMTAQINELVSRAKLNDKQAEYVGNMALGLSIDNRFKSLEHRAGLNFTNAQIRQINETVKQIRQNVSWTPFNNIVGAATKAFGPAAAAAAGATIGSQSVASEVKSFYPSTSTFTGQ